MFSFYWKIICMPVLRWNLPEAWGGIYIMKYTAVDHRNVLPLPFARRSPLYSFFFILTTILNTCLLTCQRYNVSSINKISKLLDSILSNLNKFHPVEVADRVRETQLHVGKNTSCIIWRLIFIVFILRHMIYFEYNLLKKKGYNLSYMDVPGFILR